MLGAGLWSLQYGLPKPKPKPKPPRRWISTNMTLGYPHGDRPGDTY